MTGEEISSEIGRAAVERKGCRDRISCYQERLKKALYGIQILLDENKNSLLEENQYLVGHVSDPCEDAKGYIEMLKREEELRDFLRTHNAL